MIKSFQPTSREEWLAGRGATVGASELPALFGAHADMTAYELFAIKSGSYKKYFPVAEITADAIHLPPTEKGNLFEDDAFELLGRLRPQWTITPNQIPGGWVFVDEDARMSSTPDAFATEPDWPGKCAIQVKTTNDRIFRETWQVEGVVEPPVSVSIQTIADATLSGCDRAYAAVMVVGFRTSLYLMEVPLHAPLMTKARALVADFWTRIAENRPYEPDFARDGAVIAGLFGQDNGAEIDLTGNNRVIEIISRRAELKEIEAQGSGAEKERKALDTEIIHLLGNATRGALANGGMIEAKTVNRKGYEVKPSSYRTVRIKENTYVADRRGARAPVSQQSANPTGEASF